MRDFFIKLGTITFRQYILVEIRKERKDGTALVRVYVEKLGLEGVGRTLEEAIDDLEQRITEIMYEGKDLEKIRLINEVVESIGGD